MSASTHSPVLKHHFDNLEQQHASERLGIWMFLATEVLFFGGLFGAYTVYRLWYPTEFEFASSHLNRTIATVNTVFLITSSLTMTLGDPRGQARRQRPALIRNLLITAALGHGVHGDEGVRVRRGLPREVRARARCSRSEYAAEPQDRRSPRLAAAAGRRSITSSSPGAHSTGRQDLASRITARPPGDAGYIDPGKVQLFLVLLLHHDRHPRHPHHRRDRVHPVAGVGGAARHDPAGELLDRRGGQPLLALGGRDLAVPDAAAVPGRRGVCPAAVGTSSRLPRVR